MPTGYTAGVADGTITTFQQFALQCARAMGALAMMRDEPFDAPIPDEIQPDTKYYDERIAEAQAILERLPALTAEQCEAEAEKAHAEEMADYNRRQAEDRETRARYEAMLERVRAWKPPTPDHVGMRDFMEERLVESIQFDCGLSSPPPAKMSGREWRVEQIELAARKLQHMTAERAKEIARTAERNAWLKALRESLT